MRKIRISTRQREDIIDLTAIIQEHLTADGSTDGLLCVYSPHTTAAITVNENADPDVKSDLNRFLKKLVPQNSGFDHNEGNSDAHIKGTLVNFSQTFIVENAQVQLGTWQGIFLMEFDGPRNREIWLKFIPTAS